MKIPIRNSRNRRAQGAGRSLRSEDGVTLVEVIVSTVMVALIGFTLVGLDAAGQTTADQRNRSEAAEIAHADQERIKGLSADQVATLDQERTVTVDKVDYEIHSQGQFISASADTADCTSEDAAADYAKVVSTVDWDANRLANGDNRRPPVVEQSLITPPAGGSVIGRVNDPTGAGLPGAAISVAGTDPKTSTIRRRGATDSSGCTIFSALMPGNYSMSASLSGYVDHQGKTPSADLTATSGNTTTRTFTLGKAGALQATFTTKVNGTILTNQRASAIMWSNVGMATPGKATASSPATSISSPKSLFPFTTSAEGYDKNYTVWAGSCDSDRPQPDSRLSYATVSPGVSNAPVAVSMPALVLKITVDGSPAAPEHLVLKDSCGDSSQPEIASNAASAPTGALKYPGQPYSSSYTVCADATGYIYYAGKYYPLPFHATATVANTDFTNGTTKTINIPTSYPYSAYGSC